MNQQTKAPSRRATKLHPSPILQEASRWDHQCQSTRSKMCGNAISFSKSRLAEASAKVEELKHKQPAPEHLPLYNADLSFHRMLAIANDRGALAGEAKIVISHLMSIVGIIADKPPSVLLRIDPKSETPPTLGDLLNRIADLESDLGAAQAALAERDRCVEALNAKIAELEAQLESATQPSVAKTLPGMVNVEHLKTLFVTADTILNKYCEHFTSNEPLPADDFNVIYGAISTISQELEQHMALPQADLDVLKEQAAHLAKTMQDNNPAQALNS